MSTVGYGDATTLTVMGNSSVLLPPPLSLSLSLSVVTMSTVGYGDVTTLTVMGNSFILLLLSFCLSFLSLSLSLSLSLYFPYSIPIFTSISFSFFFNLSFCFLHNFSLSTIIYLSNDKLLIIPLPINYYHQINYTYFAITVLCNL